GLSVASNQLRLTTADSSAPVAVPELTDAEADPTTGDVRKLFYALCEMMYQARNAIAPEDLPVQMQIFRTSSVNDVTGEITRTYTLQFVTEATGVEVADEPA